LPAGPINSTITHSFIQFLERKVRLLLKWAPHWTAIYRFISFVFLGLGWRIFSDCGNGQKAQWRGWGIIGLNHQRTQHFPFHFPPAFASIHILLAHNSAAINKTQSSLGKNKEGGRGRVWTKIVYWKKAGDEPKFCLK
jgi:hypothetical protein